LRWPGERADLPQEHENVEVGGGASAGVDAPRAVGAEVVDVGLSDHRLVPDAVVSLGEWELSESGECVELVCVVMRASDRGPGEGVPLEIVRRGFPAELRELAWFVLEVWGEARGVIA
jgi:hypothetical protein